jgi:hypothetical protein
MDKTKATRMTTMMIHFNALFAPASSRPPSAVCCSLQFFCPFCPGATDERTEE